MPDKYAKCILSIRAMYPQFVIQNFESPQGEDPRIESDRMRLRRLSEIEDDALYIDADCVPGKRVFDPKDFKRVAFGNNVGGCLENWAIFKPSGHNDVIMNLMKIRNIYTYLAINRPVYDMIYGYPTDDYFHHNAYGGPFHF